MQLPLTTVVTTALAGILTAGGIGIFTTHTTAEVNRSNISDMKDDIDKLQEMADNVAYIRAYVEQEQRRQGK